MREHGRAVARARVRAAVARSVATIRRSTRPGRGEIKGMTTTHIAIAAPEGDRGTCVLSIVNALTSEVARDGTEAVEFFPGDEVAFRADLLTPLDSAGGHEALAEAAHVIARNGYVLVSGWERADDTAYAEIMEVSAVEAQQ